MKKEIRKELRELKTLRRRKVSSQRINLDHVRRDINELVREESRLTKAWMRDVARTDRRIAILQGRLG